MNDLNNAIRFNAEAAGLILSGRYTHATRKLSHTLQTLQGSYKRSRRVKQVSLMAASYVDPTSSMSSSLSDPSLHSKSRTFYQAPGSGYVFREPITSNDMGDTSPVEALRRMIAIVLYNLALAHHLQGLRIQKKGKTSRIATFHLQTAQSMYELCLKIQIKNRFDLGNFHKLLVLPNNLGQVAKSLGRAEAASRYMAFLAKQLDQFLLQAEESSSHFPSRDSEIEHFLENTSQFITANITAVPC